jgi:hypothetical protein
MSETLPPGATVYAKRPLPATPEQLSGFLSRELGIVERAIRDRRLRLQRETTASLTLGAQDEIVYADATGGAITITLPDARRFWGYEYTIKRLNAGANLVTIDGDGALIDGGATFPIGTQYEAITVSSDGEAWWIV